MKFSELRQDKGVAGLTILLSLVTMLFVIGLLVFIFVLMGAEFKDIDSLSASESTTAKQTTGTMNETGVTLTTCDTANQGVISSITSAWNVTGDVLIASGNYTYSGCIITYTGTDTYVNDSVWNVTYVYTYAGTGWDVVNETSSSIGTVTDWFDIFIVIGAMVVLILLTVIIITAIRGSGLIAGSSKGAGNVGSA